MVRLQGVFRRHLKIENAGAGERGDIRGRTKTTNKSSRPFSAKTTLICCLICAYLLTLTQIDAAQSTRRKSPKRNKQRTKSPQDQCSHLQDIPSFPKELLNHLKTSRPEEANNQCGSSRCCRGPIWSFHKSQVYVLMSQYKTRYWKEKIQEEFDRIRESLESDINAMFDAGIDNEYYGDDDHNAEISNDDATATATDTAKKPRSDGAKEWKKLPSWSTRLSTGKDKKKIKTLELHQVKIKNKTKCQSFL